MIDRITDRTTERSSLERAATTRRGESIERKPMTQLLQDTATQLQDVMRGEVRVAISKARDEVTAIARASVLRAAAAVVGVIGLVLVMLSAIAFLEGHMARWLAVLIVAVINLGLAAVLAKLPVARRNT